MRTFLYLLFVLYVTVGTDAALGQDVLGVAQPAGNRQAAVSPAQPIIGSGRVSGRVLSTLGAPIPKANIRLLMMAAVQPSQPGQASTFLEISGSDGSFTFENVPAGRFSLMAQRAGYAQEAINMVAGQLSLAAGETKQNVEVKLSPLAAISGRVLDRDGDPVPNAQVRTVRYGYQQGRMILQQTAAGNSDDRGHFRISNITPGRYYVLADDLTMRANQGNQEIRGRSAQEANLTTYYPSAADPRNGTRLDVKAGMEFEGIDVRMARGQTVAVRGVVTDGLGVPMQAQLTLNLRDSISNGRVPLQASSQPATGAFSFGAVPAGDYILTARSTGVRTAATDTFADGIPRPAPVQVQARSNPPQPVLFGRFDLTVRAGNVEDVRLQLVPGPTLTGRVIVEGGAELGIMVTNTAVNGTVSQTRRPATFSLVELDGPSTTVAGQVQADGTFSILNMSPALYAINTGSLTAQAYLKSIRLGGQDVTNQPLDFRSGAGGPLEIVLGNKPAQVTGTVQNSKDEAAISAGVILWPKTPRSSDPTGGLRVTRSNQTGGFTLPNLAPGEYYIAAWEDANQEFLRAPDFLARFNTNANTVKLTEGATESVNLKWITRETTDKEASRFPE